MVKISFVLPCYNVERYIADCLNSIYTQDLPEEDFEVICVNDCSTDGTCMIIEEWQTKHSNLHLIHHSKNMHVGIARNTGIKHAVGKYVCFVDADDYLTKNVMKKLVLDAIDDSLDVLLFNNVIDYKGEILQERIVYADSVVMSGDDYVEKYLNGSISKLGSPWAKLFNRTFLLKHSIWYSDLIYSEDAAFVWEVMICAKRVKSISDNGYVYRGNETSFTSNIKKPYILYTISILYPMVLLDVLNRYGNEVPNVFRRGMDNAIETAVNCFFRDYLSYEEEERMEIFSLIQKNTTFVWKLKDYIHRRQKVAFLSRNLGYNIFDANVKRLFT